MRMGLQNRTVLILLIATFLSTALVVTVSRLIYVNSYKTLEWKVAEDAADRAMVLLNQDLRILDTNTKDWAFWDDCYEYMVDGNRDFEESNLAPNAFINLDLSSAFFVGLNGKPRYSYVSDAGARPLFAEAMVRLIAAISDQGGTGVLSVGPSLHLYAARPILPSDGQGPRVGFLVMTRIIDASHTKNYSQLIGYAVKVTVGDEEATKPRTLQQMNNQDIEISRDLVGPEGDPIGRLSLTVPRNISKFGDDTFHYYLTVLLFSFAAIAIIIGLVMDRLVFSPIRRLGAEINHIAEGKSHNARVSIPWEDEIGELGMTVNRALDALDTRFREREYMLREIHHRVGNNLQIVGSLLSLQAANSSDDAVRKALAEGNRRINLMAALHKGVYEGKDLSRIDMEEFFRKITQSLGGSGRASVDLSLQEDVGGNLDIDKAIPLGLLINEIIFLVDPTSETEHMRPLQIGVSRTFGRGIEIGLEGRVPRETNGHPLSDHLSLAIIEALTSQLNGTIEISDDEGAKLATLSILIPITQPPA